jgi:hypothetical protein
MKTLSLHHGCPDCAWQERYRSGLLATWCEHHRHRRRRRARWLARRAWLAIHPQ